MTRFNFNASMIVGNLGESLDFGGWDGGERGWDEAMDARDEEQHRLDERFKELEEERRKFTDAAVRLGKEKAALEVCRYVVVIELF